MAESVPLPIDGQGHTYITDLMLAEHPHLGAFLKRTEAHWKRDELSCRYVLVQALELRQWQSQS